MEKKNTELTREEKELGKVIGEGIAKAFVEAFMTAIAEATTKAIVEGVVKGIAKGVVENNKNLKGENMNVRFIDDHTGKEPMYDVIGIWINERNPNKIGLATARPHSINKLYIEDGVLHLSRASIGPAAMTDDIDKGLIETPFGEWKLIKMNEEEIYELIKENQAKQSA
jgi:hypothetical protein